jgi:hypothetical protein
VSTDPTASANPTSGCQQLVKSCQSNATAGGTANTCCPKNVAVREGSTTPGTDLIQWWADGGGEQQWDGFDYSNNPSVIYFKNINSGLCIATDGVAADPLGQEPCSSSNVHEQWVSAYVWWAFGYTFVQPRFGP